MFLERLLGKRAYSTSILVGFVSLAVLLPFVVLVGIGIWHQLAVNKTAELERVTRASETLVRALDRELTSDTAKARIMGSLHFLAGDHPEELRKALDDAKKAESGDFILIDETGQQLANTRLPPDAVLPKTKNLPLVLAALEAGRPVIENLAFGTTSGRFDFGVFVPIEGAPQRRVLVYVPPTASIQRIALDQVSGNGWAAAILDGNGRIVARTEQYDRFFGKQANPDFLARLTGTSGLLESVDLQGRPSYTAYHASDISGWTAVVWVPQAVVHAPGTAATREMLAAILAACLVSALLSRAISKLVHGPIRQLTANARQVGEGLVTRPIDSWMREANQVSDVLSEASREVSARQAEASAATRAAQLSERRFRELVSGLRDAVVWEGDPKTLRFTYVSDGAESLLGFPVSQWIDDASFWLTHVHPDDRPFVADHCQRETGAGRDHVFEYRMLAADGRTVWVRDTVFLGEKDGKRVSRGLIVDISKWKDAEEILRNQERLFRELTEDAPVMLWICDAQGRCQHLNKQLRNFWGVRNEDLSTFDWGSTMHPDDAPRIGKAVGAALAERRGFAVEGRYRTAAGDYRVLQTNSSPRFSRDGSFLGLIGVNLDVTESLAAVTALKESEQRLRIATEIAELGIVEWRIAIDDAEFENGRMLEIFGHAPGDVHLSKRAFMEGYIYPDDAPVFDAAITEALESGVFGVTCRIRRKSDGALRWIECAGTIAFDGYGMPERLIGVVADITDRKNAEEELLRSTALLRAVSDGVDDLIFVKDREDRFLFANPATARVLGQPLPALLGKTGLEDALVQSEGAIIQAHDFQVLDTGEPLVVEETFTGPEGHRTYMAHKVPMRDSQGRIVGLIAVARDITQRKIAEEQTKLLLREVTHRAKNILAVTQAMVRQTARDSDPASLADRLNARLAGLATSHDLLVESDWKSVGVRQLILAQMSHYRDLIGTRLVLKGPDFGLKPAATQTLGMALHELATNASKYGAFSNQMGIVKLSWRFFRRRNGEQRFEMKWQEQKGPPVAKPARRGFGHSVTVRMVEHGLEATVDLAYAPSGLSWKVDAPVSAVTSKGQVFGAVGRELEEA